MSVYHWLVVLVVLLAILLHGERKGNKTYILFAVLLMFCVYGLRDAETIGADSSSSYLHAFERLENTTWDDMPGLSDWFSNDDIGEENAGRDRNVGFQWLMKLVYDLSDGDYQWFIVVIAAFVMVAVAHLIRRFSPSPVQSILYYFGLIYFTMMFNALKQSVAMGFVMFAFCALIDRKPIKFVILVLVGSMFHFPALVFLPAYWVTKMKVDRNYLILLALLFIATYFFRDRLVDWMTDTYDTTVHENTAMNFLTNKVLVMLVIIVAALVIRPPSSEDKLYCALLQIIGIAAVIQTFSRYNNTFERLADYYFQFAIVFIPLVFENVKTERRYLNTRTLALVQKLGPYLFCAFAIWRFLDTTVNDATIYPYQFYFQAENAEETISVLMRL